MSMRISSSQITDSSLFQIQQTYSRFASAQAEVNTGKKIQKPSDDPSGTSQVLDFQEQMAEISQYSRNINNAKNFLATTETALSSVVSLTHQARSIAVQAANGTNSASAQSALAGQLNDIISQIASIGNTTYGSQYVFSGQRTNTAPLQSGPSGYTYNGGTTATGDGDIHVDIARSQSVKINVTGDQVFVPLLTTLSKVSNDIAGGSLSNVSSDLANIDTQLNTAQAAQADTGSKVTLLQQTLNNDTSTTNSLTAFVSNLQDADIPTAVVSLQTAQTAYNAALAATSRSFQNSLLDFIK